MEISIHNTYHGTINIQLYINTTPTHHLAVRSDVSVGYYFSNNPFSDRCIKKVLDSHTIHSMAQLTYMKITPTHHLAVRSDVSVGYYFSNNPFSDRCIKKVLDSHTLF